MGDVSCLLCFISLLYKKYMILTKRCQRCWLVVCVLYEFLLVVSCSGVLVECTGRIWLVVSVCVVVADLGFGVACM